MDIGTVQQVDINSEMKSAYLDYAMSVIVARALPDSRDGMKPVHRRILYAMYDMGIRSAGSHRKSARIVGEVLGKYHPHSDQAVYDSMARMAQEFSLRYMLVDGQGNFGSIGGDPPAAMRYTEAKMSKLAEEMLVDINKNTVDFIDNFDASEQEPVVLPARLPNLLLNGSSGIAVGMASNIPPHNLTEIVNATKYLIDHYDNLENIMMEDLMQFVSGPDFPTGGIIVGTEGIRQMFSSGRGKITLRGKAQIEEMRGGKHRIVISEIPYQVNLTNLIERIADLARSGRLAGVSDLRDESDRTGMNIILELKRGAQPRTVLNRLYKYTPLQTTFSAQILALVDQEPRTLSLKRSLQIFLEHRQEVITRRVQFDLDKAKARAHILEGLLIAINNIDEVIKTIRAAKDVETAKTQLISKFELTEIQAQAILDMQLRRLAALERMKIETEYKEILEMIDYLEDLLAHPKKILALIKHELTELEEKFGDERRTIIDLDGTKELNEEDLVKDEDVFISITQRGYIKRVTSQTYRSQGRGGRGVIGHATKDEDEVMIFLPARTLETVLFFSDRGKVYSEKVYRIPDAGRTAKGIPVINILGVSANETITAAVRVIDFKKAEYTIMATKKGKTKRVDLHQFASVRPSGLIAMNLADDDSLGWARLTNGENDIMLVTRNGQALRFSEKAVRPMGRTAAGVKGIRLRGDDVVTSMDVVEPGGDLLIITDKGYGKRTSLEQYARKGRATLGVKTIDTNAISIVGHIIAARVVQKSDEVTLISSQGVVLRTKVDNISTAGRATRGVRVMNLTAGDTVAALARFRKLNDLSKDEKAEEPKAEVPDIEDSQAEEDVIDDIPVEDSADELEASEDTSEEQEE